MLLTSYQCRYDPWAWPGPGTVHDRCPEQGHSPQADRPEGLFLSLKNPEQMRFRSQEKKKNPICKSQWQQR